MGATGVFLAQELRSGLVRSLLTRLALQALCLALGRIEKPMNRRSFGFGMLLGAVVLASGLATACGSDGASEASETGVLNLPLVTHAPSGAEYRLRHATFEINGAGYYGGSGGEGGVGDNPHNRVVHSDDYLDDAAISLSLERGYYYVTLLPGWQLEKVEKGVATPVAATLLSNQSQWTYVNQRSSTWVTFQFGLGERSIWFNGELTINVEVYEKPSDLYGNVSGAGGQP